MIERCGVLAQSGIDFILVREKDLAAGALVSLCGEVLAAVREVGARTRVLVSSRVDVAMAAGLDGVHLSSHDCELTPEQVRQLMPNAFVSASCHTLEEVERARTNGASAVLFAPIFRKTVRGVEVAVGLGLETLSMACATAREMPVFALGGVTNENTAACLDVGASGIAGIRVFFGTAGISPTMNLVI